MTTEYNRQYIGARYVPKFFENPNGSWDWAQGFQYEPLTIVKYGENTYTSKQLVPSTVGAPNENPEYWANTGNYNGFMIDIQNQIITINNRLDAPKDFYLIGGDSYMLQGWGSKLVNALNLESSDYILADNNDAGFSPAFFPTTDSHKSFKDQLQSIYEKVPVGREVTQIIFGGGYNELQANNPTLTSNGIIEFINFIKTNMPKANVTILFVANSTGEASRIPLVNFRNLYLKMTQYGCKTADCSPSINNPTLFTDDKIHPNIEGYNFLSSMIINVVKGSNSLPTFPTINSIKIRCTAAISNTNIPQGDTHMIITTYDNFNKRLIIPQRLITFSSPVTLSDSYAKILEFEVTEGGMTTQQLLFKYGGYAISEAERVDVLINEVYNNNKVAIYACVNKITQVNQLFLGGYDANLTYPYI